MKTIRYCWHESRKQGEARHPMEVVKELGMTVIEYEAVGIADCSMMEVENIPDELPSFIRHTDYVLTYHKQ